MCVMSSVLPAGRLLIGSSVVGHTPATDVRTYRPYGAARDVLLCRDPEVLIDGPAGTGKSRACLTKLFICCEKYAGMRAQILRKYRRSLTDAALVTWEDEVVPPDHECLRGAQREQRHTYRFPNGSTVTVRGLDDPEKQRSSQYDLVYVQEATELDVDDLNNVLRGLRNGVMPYQQLIMDCNPDAPHHWLKLRYEAGHTTRFASSHQDNPILWDHKTLAWTMAGIAYMARLDTLTGTTRMRLRDGIWAAAEGAVYDAWDPDKHVTKSFVLPAHWTRYLGLDFGGQNTAALFYAADPETDILYLYREYLAGGRSAGQHVPFLLAGEVVTPFCVGGSRSEGQWRLEFAEAGLDVLPPLISDVGLGITRVNGQHRKSNIIVFSDACPGYLAQKTSYRYADDVDNPETIEKKRHYHYMDAERYIIGYLRPEQSIIARQSGRGRVARAIAREC
jgi:Phage terminase large subunit